MYIPPAFRDHDPDSVVAAIRAARLATLVTATADGLIATPLPMMIDPADGPHGTLYAHLARANPQWTTPPIGEAMAVFMGPDAYISPSWYPAKQEHGKVVPTWNYVAIHAYGPAEFIEDPAVLLDAVTRLTQLHEAARPDPWAVSDAPAPFVAAQLKGIVALRMRLTRIDAKRKMSQNRAAPDRNGVVAGLSASPDPRDRAAAALVPTGER